MKKLYFAVSRWNLTGGIVRQGFGLETATEAEAKGRRDQETYQDQKFERVFFGTHPEFYALVKVGGVR